jgi:tetratricopeptide (TPR) repeat protein
MLERLHPGGSPDRADLQISLARAHLELGNVDAATTAAAEATAFWKRFDPVNRAAGLAQLWQARSLLAGRRDNEAARSLQQAAEVLATTALPRDRALLARTGHELGARQIARR